MLAPSDTSRDPILGITVDSFVVKTKLAEGGMGAVYLAVHERLPNKKKVLKVLLAEFSSNPAIRTRFEREAQTASRIEHPHVVKIDSFGTLPDGQLYLLMPYLEGKALDTHLGQNGKLTLHHTCHIMLQVWSALDCLHEAGITHRDLKPSNIFIQEMRDNAYHVTVIDLGIAKDAAQAATEKAAKLITQAGTAIGTPGYMAVEQYDDAAKVTSSVDVYASAIVTWELLTGQRPWGFHQAGVLHHLQMTISPEPPAGEGHAPEVFDVLRKALDPHVEERFESARALAVAFASLVPAIPPHVPSGARMMSRLAPDLLTKASPEIMTVRDRVGSEPDVPSSWPYRDTRVTPLASSPELDSATLREPKENSPPTVSHRAPAASPRDIATLPSLGWRWIVLAVVASAAIGVAAFFVVRARRAHVASSRRDAGLVTSSAAAAAPVPPPDAPAPTLDATVVEAAAPSPEPPRAHATKKQAKPAIERGRSDAGTSISPPARAKPDAAATGSDAPFDIDAVEK